MKRQFTCPCCGYPGLDCPPNANMPRVLAMTRGAAPPYRVHFGEGSYDVCACCGFEFGYDDEPAFPPGESFASYLLQWTAGGCKWFTPAARPVDWSLVDQLAAAGLPMPDASPPHAPGKPGG